MALMLAVNLAHAGPPFPSWWGHAGWNEGRHGQGLADFVFPWFLFIVGAAVPFSMTSGRGASKPWASKIAGAARRALVIYALGVLIAWSRSAGDTLARQGRPIGWSSLLVWDILPLIALGYLVAVLLYAGPRWSWWAFVLAVMAGKAWILPDLASTAGLDRAPWSASRTDLDADWRNVAWIGTGITQGLPAAAATVLGMIAGDLLRRASTGDVRAARAGWWIVLGGAGVIVAGVVWERLGMPYSKDFFTPTYVLLSAGTGAVLLGMTFLILDESRAGAWRVSRMKASFFEVFGRNAIALYVAHEVLWPTVMMRWRVKGPDGDGLLAFVSLKAWLGEAAGPTMGPWLAIAAYVGVWWVILWRMHRRGVYVKV